MDSIDIGHTDWSPGAYYKRRGRHLPAGAAYVFDLRVRWRSGPSKQKLVRLRCGSRETKFAGMFIDVLTAIRRSSETTVPRLDGTTRCKSMAQAYRFSCVHPVQQANLDPAKLE